MIDIEKIRKNFEYTNEGWSEILKLCDAYEEQILEIEELSLKLEFLNAPKHIPKGIRVFGLPLNKIMHCINYTKMMGKI